MPIRKTHSPLHLIFLTTFIFILVACSPAETPAPTATATPDLRTPLALTAEANNQKMTQEAQTTADAQATLDAEATKVAQEAQATADALATEATATAVFVATADAQATSKADAANKVATKTAATAQANAEATAQAETLFARIQSLYDEGLVRSTEGTYYVMPNFDEKWAQINWYQWYPTFVSPTNFVIRGDLAWDSGSDTANWFASGCGFVFRAEDNDNHYVAWLTLDGYVSFVRQKSGYQTSLGSDYYGPLDKPSGNAEIMLIVDDTWILFYVNGKLVHRRQDQGLTDGMLAYTLVSGTNKDFGTHCLLTNVELWEFDE